MQGHTELGQTEKQSLCKIWQRDERTKEVTEFKYFETVSMEGEASE